MISIRHDMGFSPEPIFVSPQITATGEHFLVVCRRGEKHTLQYPGAGAFEVSEAHDRITCHPEAEADPALIDDIYTSSVLTFRGELRGVRGMHASAAIVGGQAVGFLANSGSGKSSLAAAMIAAGYALLSDDVLPVEEVGEEFIAHPGYPRLRLWPQQARDLGIDAVGEADIPDKLGLPVGAGGIGDFHAAAVPLARLYLLERRPPGDPDIEIAILPLSPRDAVIELVRFSFLPRLTAAAGLQPGRLAFFARMAARVPLSRLSYPSGVERLPQVVERIVEV